MIYEYPTSFRSVFILIIQAFILLHLLSTPAEADLVLGPEEFVEADSTIIKVPGYSVPSFTYWDGDGLKDLIIGEGGGGYAEGKVRIYLNVGSVSIPRFSAYFYAQSEGADLVCPGSG